MSGTATMKRSAVSVMGGMLPRPSFVIGIDSLHISASSSMAPRLFIDRGPIEVSDCGATVTEFWDTSRAYGIGTGLRLNQTSPQSKTEI